MGKLSTLVVDLQLQSAQLKTELQAVHAKLDSFSGKALQVGTVLKGVLSADVLRSGFEALKGFLDEGVKDFVEDERASNKLGAAMRQLGYDSQALLPVFQRQAEGLEATTLVSQAQIYQVQQLMLQYGAAPSTISPATAAVLDYAAATGQDAVAATRQMMNAVATGKEDIARLGISYQTTGDMTQDLERATTALEKKFGGTAQSATEGMSGALDKMAQRTGELSKALVDFTVKTGLGKTVIDTLTKTIEGMTYALSDEHAEESAAEERQNRWNQQTNLKIKLTDELNALIKEQARLTSEGDTANARIGLAIAQQRIDAVSKELELTRQRIAAVEAEKAAASKAKIAAVIAERGALSTGPSAEAQKIADERKRVVSELQKEANKAQAELTRVALQAEEKALKATHITEFALMSKRLGPGGDLHDSLEKAGEKAGELARRILEAAVAYDALRSKKLALETDRSNAALSAQLHGISADSSKRQQAYADIGDPVGAAQAHMATLRQATSGFANFNAALMMYAYNARQAAALRNEADVARAKGDELAALAAENTAIEFDKLAQKGSDAADAFAEIKARQVEFIDGLSSKLMGSRLSGLVQAGQNGASVGGPWGAAAAVGIELLTQSKQFQQTMQTVDSLLQMAADALGIFLEPINAALEPLKQLFAALTPLSPVLQLLAMPLKFLADVIRQVALMILGIVRGFALIWNGIMDLIALIGIKTEGAKIDEGALLRSMNELQRGTSDTTTAVSGLGDAAREATEEILNAPQGFKSLALARWQSANPDEAPPWSGGGGTGSGGGGTGGGGGGGAGTGGGGSGGPKGPGRGAGHVPGASGLNVAPVVVVDVALDVQRYVQVEGHLGGTGDLGAGDVVSVGGDNEGA